MASSDGGHLHSASLCFFLFDAFLVVLVHVHTILLVVVFVLALHLGLKGLGKVFKGRSIFPLACFVKLRDATSADKSTSQR